MQTDFDNNATDSLDGVSVHTGFPNPGADARLHGLDINRLLVQNSTSTFLMRISGTNWQHLGIFHGDITVIDRSLHARINDLVVWHCGGDFAISERNRMRPDAVMWGVVTATIHQFRKPEEGAA
jgi:DNA polymerase V